MLLAREELDRAQLSLRGRLLVGPVRRRLQGVLVARQYVMIDYDCPRSLLEQATAITPGLESPTVAPMADPEWAAVRAMVPRRDHQNLMDELSELGARAILASDIRSCRF